MATSEVVIKASDQTRAAFKSVKGGLDQVNGRVNAVIGSVTALAGAGGFGLLIKSQLEATRKATAYSRALDIQIQSLTAWQSAGRLVNIENDKMADIFKDLTEKIGDAVTGGGEAADVLKRLGINVADIAALAPDQQLLKIAGALDKIGTTGEKVIVLEDLASDASLLLPLLENNAAGFREARDAAERYGSAISAVDAQSIQDANIELDKAGQIIDGLTKRSAAELAPTIERMAVGFQNLLGSAADFFDLESDQERLNELLQERGKILQVINDININGQQGPRKVQLENLQKELAENEKISAELQAQLASVEQKKQASIQAAESRKAKLQEEITLREQLKEKEGGDKAAEKAAIREAQLLEQSVELLRTSLFSQEEVIRESFFKRGLILEEALENNLLKETEYADLRNQLSEQTEARITDLKRDEAEKQQQTEERFNQLKADAVSGTFSNLATLMNAQSKRLFEIGKKAALASALVNTYQAITKTMAETPYPWNIPLAAAQAVAGAVQVQNIRSQSYGGGGSVGGVPSAGVGAATGQPVGAQPPPQGAANNAESGGSVTINIHNPELLSNESITQLVEGIGEQIENRDLVLISPTSRNGQELGAQ